MTDALAAWLRVRADTDWDLTRTHPTGPVSGHRDGVVEYARSLQAAPDPARGQRLMLALDDSRRDAVRRRPLSFTGLARWQRLVLDRRDVPFRTRPASAKQGRERYGLGPDTPALFDRCMAEATGTRPNVAARAAWAYLDVCFFHPFVDGNARAAMLALDHVLSRDGVRLARAEMISVHRRADDPLGGLALADLLSALINSTGTAHRTSHRPAGPAQTWAATSRG